MILLEEKDDRLKLTVKIPKKSCFELSIAFDNISCIIIKHPKEKMGESKACGVKWR